MAKAKLLVVYHSIFITGLEAARIACLPEDRVVIISNGDEPASDGYQTLCELVRKVSRLYPEPLFDESLLTEGEAKTKTAVSIPFAMDLHLCRHAPTSAIFLPEPQGGLGPSPFCIAWLSPLC